MSALTLPIIPLAEEKGAVQRPVFDDGPLRFENVAGDQPAT
jgi:hypothetical protein